MSVNKQSLLTALGNGPVTVTFTKQDGSVRVMRCTLNESSIPANKRPSTPTNTTGDLIPVFDTEANDWRSFYASKVTKVEN